MSANLMRWGGPAAMMAGVLVIPIIWLSLLVESFFYLMIPVMLLLVVALAGLHARQDARSGRLERVGFVIAVLGAGAVAVLAAFVGVAVALFGLDAENSALGPIAFFAFIVFMIGILLFGIGTARVGVLPRLAGGLIAVAFPVGLAIDLIAGSFSSGEATAWGFSIGFTVFGIGLIWLGYAAWAERGASAAQPSRVS